MLTPILWGLFMKTYLVSGAGSGIGQAISLVLAKTYDAKIVLVGRREDALRKTQELLPNPGSHFVVAADTLDGKKLRDGFQKIKLDELNLHGIIANAGVGGGNAYGTNDRWSEIINTNLTGAYTLVNEALPALKNGKEKYKHVILISSILSSMGVPGYTAYCASKAGLLGLMRSWSVELCEQNILVNAVCPGWVETDMARSGIQALADHLKIGFETAYQQQMSILPLKKWSQPAEIGGLVSYLVSPYQTSITGQALHINNGALMP